MTNSAAEMVARRFHEIRERDHPSAYDFTEDRPVSLPWEQLPRRIRDRAVTVFAEMLGPDGCLDVRYLGSRS
jgi:hypothetical protein